MYYLQSKFNTRYLTLLCILIFLENNSFSQSYKESKLFFQTRVYVFPLLSFSNSDHPGYSSGIHTALGLGGGVKEELIFHKGISCSIGLEYIHHSLSFDSYYFAPTYSTIYDKKYIALHTIKIAEAQIPFLIKFIFPIGFEQAHPNMIYIDAGWIYRYFVSADANIALKGGKDLWSGKTDLNMEYPLFTNKGASMMQVGLGYEHDHKKNGKAIFVESVFKYGLSRYRYSGNGTSNDLLIGNSFFSLGLGYKF